MAIGYPADRGIVLYFTQSEFPPPHHRALSNRIEMSGLFHHPGPDMVWAADTDIREVSLADAQRAEYVGFFRGTAPWLEESTWEAQVSEEGELLQLSEGRSGSLLRQRVHLVPLDDDLFVFGHYEDGDLVGVDPPARVRFLREEERVTKLEISFDGEVGIVLDKIGIGE